MSLAVLILVLFWFARLLSKNDFEYVSTRPVFFLESHRVAAAYRHPDGLFFF
jgi:hypothetical protein